MMRKLWVIAALMAALAAGAAAQRGGRGGGGDTVEGPPRQERPTRLDRVTEYLKLSHDQRRDFKDIMDAGQKEAAPLREELRRGRADLAAAIAAGNGNAEVGNATKKYAEAQARMAGIELQAFAKIFKLLDSDQQAKTRAVFLMMRGVFQNRSWMELEER